jgi:hypothetical protein
MAKVRPIRRHRGGSQSAAAPQVDIDELARQVYANIKRRLTVELERLRGR